MRRYEMMFLMNAALPEDDRQAVIDRVKDEVEELGGSIARASHYDVRDLAYTIQDTDRAAYHLIRFRLDGASVQEFKNRLNLMDDLLRFLIIHLEEQDLAFTGSFTEPEDKEDEEVPEEAEDSEDDQADEDDEEAAAEETDDEEDEEDEEEPEDEEAPAAEEEEGDEEEPDEEDAASADEEDEEEDGEEASDEADEDEGEEASDEDEEEDEEAADDEAGEEAEEEEEPAEAT